RPRRCAARSCLDSSSAWAIRCSGRGRRRGDLVDGPRPGDYALWAVRAIRLFFALGPVTLAGCVFFASFDDLMGGPGGDAGEDASEAASLADAGPVRPPEDGPGPGDAGGDTGVDPTSPGGKQPPHDLCDDFDEAGLGQRWSGMTAVNGTLVLDKALALTP